MVWDQSPTVAGFYLYYQQRFWDTVTTAELILTPIFLPNTLQITVEYTSSKVSANKDFGKINQETGTTAL